MSMEIKMVAWMVNSFPESIKNRFLGMCKMKGINWKKLLANLIKEWMYEQEKGNKK